MLFIIVTVLLIMLIAYAAFWIIDQAGTPAPFNMILKLIVGIVALLELLQRTGLLN